MTSGGLAFVETQSNLFNRAQRPPIALYAKWRHTAANKISSKPAPVLWRPRTREMNKMFRANRFALACLTTALATLAGCAGHIRYPSYYALNLPAPRPPATQAKAFLGVVAVREFSAPAFLRAGSIVYRPSADQLGFYPYDRWAVDLRHTVTSAVLRNIQLGGVFQSAHLFDGRETSDYLLTGTLDDLEEVDRGDEVFVEVRLSAQFMDLRTGDVLWRDTLSERSRVERRAIPGVVAELSHGTERAVDGLVSSLQNHVASQSASLARAQAGQQ